MLSAFSVSFLFVRQGWPGLELLIDFESALRVFLRLQVSDLELGFTGGFPGSRHLLVPFLLVLDGNDRGGVLATGLSIKFDLGEVESAFGILLRLHVLDFERGFTG